MSNNKLYIGNLSFETTQDEVNELFAQYGEVKDLKLISDYETGRSRGFAFLTFANEDDAQKCLDEEITLGNRPLKISIAKERKPRESQNRY